MTGFTKHKSNEFKDNSRKTFSKYIKELIPILPMRYDFNIIILLLKEYYPYELQLFEECCAYYELKDKKLKALNKKRRHFMCNPLSFFYKLNIIHKILDEKFIQQHELDFDIDIYLINIKHLESIRFPKINKIKEKIDKAKLKAQEVEPVFLDKLMGLYERKNALQKDKVYIFKELEKYYCPKVISFFKKKVSSEYNRQLREMAFYHLQGLMHYSVLRKQKYMRIPSKNKKRRTFLKATYANEKYSIESIPQELEYRINNSKEQEIKEFDFFISHSSTDFKEVQSMIRDLNHNRKNIYCDWINDTDYLKRHLAGDSTKLIIEKRLEQSKNVLFIKSDVSLQSKWVKYELNYYCTLNRTIFEIDKEDIIKGNYNYRVLDDLWFLDKSYREISLY